MKDTTDYYVKSPLKDSVNITGIYTVHYFKYGKNFRFQGEKHSFWEIVYIDSGSATIIADGNEFVLKQGELFLHKPDEPHAIHTSDFANSAIISFESKSRSLNLIAGKIHKLSEESKLMLNKIISETGASYGDKLNDVYLSKMTKKSDAFFGSDQIIKNFIELLLVFLIRGEEESKKVSDKALITMDYGKLVDNVLIILNEKLASQEPIDLDYISYKLGFSKTHIKAQFKKKTGYSVIQYFIKLKMDRAKELISQQKYSVSEISDILGFSSVHYFSRQFKMHTDMSPSQYAKSIRADVSL